MRAKSVNEGYEDFGLSADEAKKLKKTDNPFYKLEQMVRGFMSEDKIYFDDMVRSFDKTKQQFLYSIITDYIRKTLDIDFQNIGNPEGQYDWQNAYKAQYKIYDLYLEKSHSGYSYYVKMYKRARERNERNLVAESTYSKSLHSLAKNIQKMLKEYAKV